jgi:hypothetical protein
MPHTIRTGWFTLVALVVVATFAAAQQGMPPLPTPGPEHEVLAADVGTWDAVVETWMAPGQPPMTSKAVETNRLVAGRYLVSDFKGDFGGMAFEGHGLTWWDPASKTYKGTWVDTMSTGPMMGTSTWNPATKTVTGEMTGPDMTGTVQTMRSETVYRADGTRVMSMFMKGPDGKDMQTMRMTYTKRQ